MKRENRWTEGINLFSIELKGEKREREINRKRFKDQSPQQISAVGVSKHFLPIQ